MSNYWQVIFDGLKWFWHLNESFQYALFILVPAIFFLASFVLWLFTKRSSRKLRQAIVKDESEPLQINADNLSNEERADFEKVRSHMLTIFHSFAQNHSTYLFTITVGLIALIASVDIFIDLHIELIFYLLAFGGICLIAWMFLRIIYWTSWSNTALIITIDDAIYFFNLLNRKKNIFQTNSRIYQGIILQYAIGQVLFESYQKGEMHYLTCLAMKLARLDKNFE